MKVIVDTSIFIDYLRGGTKWQEFLDYAPPDLILYIPTIVIFELFSGKSSKKAGLAKKLSALLDKFHKIELDQKIAQHAGELFRDIGSHIDPADYIIAASALEEGAKVVTLNKKHFEKIPGVSIFDF